MHNPFWIRSYVARRYDEAAAKASYLQHMAEVAEKQDLTEDIRDRSRWLTIGFTLFATVVVGMRFMARRRQGAKLLIDDWLTVFTLVLCYGYMAMNIVCKLTTPSDANEKRLQGKGGGVDRGWVDGSTWRRAESHRICFLEFLLTFSC